MVDQAEVDGHCYSSVLLRAMPGAQHETTAPWSGGLLQAESRKAQRSDRALPPRLSSASR